MSQDRQCLLGIRGDDYVRFPWLVKFLDACGWLSVQVHPDERSVRDLWPGEGSNTEAWFILEARPGSRIYAGLRDGVDEKVLRGALENGTVLECLHSFEATPGDCVFLPAGTVHAVGGGVLMAEVQQTSDATFRLFDWNRKDAQGKPRTLHIREAVASIDWSAGPVKPVHASGFRAESGRIAPLQRKKLVHCKYFELDYLQAREPFALGGEGRMQIIVGLQGSARIHDEPVHVGHVWVLPVSMHRTACVPEALFGGLLCTLP